MSDVQTATSADRPDQLVYNHKKSSHVKSYLFVMCLSTQFCVMCCTAALSNERPAQQPQQQHTHTHQKCKPYKTTKKEVHSTHHHRTPCTPLRTPSRPCCLCCWHAFYPPIWGELLNAQENNNTHSSCFVLCAGRSMLLLVSKTLQQVSMVSDQIITSCLSSCCDQFYQNEE